MAVTAIGWLAMLATAAGSLGCVMAARPRHLGAVLAALLMLVAMLDMAAGHRLLPPIAWAAVLIAVGVVVVALPRATESPCGWQHGLALVAAAVIMIGSPHALPTASASGLGHAGHPMGSAMTGGWLLGLLVAGGYAVVAGGHLRRPATEGGPAPDRVQVLQVVSTTACLALMALLMLAG